MNKVYIIFPLIGLLIFGGFYLSFDKTYEKKLADIKMKAEDDKKAKAAKQLKEREEAMKAAVESAKKRSAELREKEAKEEAKKVARQEAEDHRQKVHDDLLRYRDQVARLKKDLDEVKTAIAKITEERKRYADEDAFLKVYVKQAEANVKYYYDLLDKIAAAEKAAADAAAAAAAAAKNKG
jgi:hypothetical protein